MEQPPPSGCSTLKEYSPTAGSVAKDRSRAIYQPKLVPDFTATTTFNGIAIVPTPLSPGYKTVELVINDSVAVSTSPFTQQTQTQSWPGADWWSGTFTLPSMTRATAVQWTSFVMALRGRMNAFLIGDPFSRTPQGVPQGVPLIDTFVTTNNAAMATSLVTKGWVANSMRNLLPGDHIQVGYRLHQVLNTVNANSSGGATIQVGPSLREQPADGTPLITHNAKGLMRLADNSRTWDVGQSRTYGMSLKFTEAR